MGHTIKDNDVGAGGHTVYNHAEANEVVGVYAQDGSGPSLYEAIGIPRPVAIGRYFGCWSENSYPDILSNTSIVIGQLSGNQNSTATVIGAGGCQNITELDNGTHQLNARLSGQDNQTLFAFSAQADDPYNAWAWRYQINNEWPVGTGWYSLCMGLGRAAPAIGVSGKASPFGAGNWRDYIGHFRGQEGETIWRKSYGTEAITGKYIEGGYRRVGSEDEQPNATPGTWRSTVVTTAGYRGFSWISSSAYGWVGGYGTLADVVEPTSGADQTWQYTDPGAWAAHTSYPNGAIVRSTNVPSPASQLWLKNETGSSFTSGMAEPTWDPVVGHTTPDNGSIWTTVGTVGVSTVEPAWPPSPVLNILFVDAQGNTWKYLVVRFNQFERNS